MHESLQDKEHYLRSKGWGWLLEARKWHVENWSSANPDLVDSPIASQMDELMQQNYDKELLKLYDLQLRREQAQT